MWIKTIKILWLYLYFAIENVNAGELTLNLSYQTVCESILESACLLPKYNKYRKCISQLKNNTLHFSCVCKWDGEYCEMLKYDRECTIPLIEGHFELDQEAMTMFHCLAVLQGARLNNQTVQCNLTEEDFQRQIFKKCNKTDVSTIVIDYFPTNYVYNEHLNFLSSNFANLKQISWRQCDYCLPFYQFIRKFQYINKLELYFCSRLLACEDFHFTNLTQIKEVLIYLDLNERNDENYTTTYINQTLLNNLNNLKIFELFLSNNESEVEVSPQLFRGLTNLTTIRFLNGNIKKLTKDHFQGLLNLRNLTLKGGPINDFDWLK